MSKKYFTDNAYLISLNLLKNDRRLIIEDSLNQSADLYDALYETQNEPLRKLKLEKYELLILRRSWESALNKVNKISEEDYYSAMRLFVKCYRSYASKVHCSVLDMNFIDTYLMSIEKLLEADRNWKDNANKFRISFLKANKIYEELIKKYSEGSTIYS